MEMQNILIVLILIVLFFILFLFYYSVNLSIKEIDKIFITITTFLFAIFTNFFISRQNNRYSKLREMVSNYDGKMSGIFRASRNLTPEIHIQIGQIIKKHYDRLLESGKWNFYFTEKTTTISDIHDLLEEKVGNNKLETLRNQAVGRIMSLLSDLQSLRKNMVMLNEENILPSQWFLLYFFIFVLFISISSLNSYYIFLSSLIKASFNTSLFAVIYILRNLDQFIMYEKFIGENSAKYILNIMDGKK